MQSKSNRSVTVRFFLIISVMVLLPSIMIALLLTSEASVKATLEQAKLSVQSIMENYAIAMEGKMKNAEVYVYQLCYNNQEGMEFLNYTEQNGLETAKIRAKKAMGAIGAIYGADGYFLYNRSMDELLTWEQAQAQGETSNMTEYDARQFFRQKIERYDGSGWRIGEKSQEPVLYLFIDFKLRGNLAGGWFDMQKSMDYLRGRVRFPHAVFSFSTQEKQADKAGTIVVNTPCYKGFILSAVVPVKEMLGGVQSVNTFLKIFVAFLLLILPLFYLQIYKLLLAPLKVIMNAQKQIQMGNLDFRITESAKSNEVENIYQSINQIANQMYRLRLEKYEEQIRYQNMKLNNLQLQVRPHFLLNTFNLIYTLAERNENASIKTVLLYLSEYFRYLFRNNNEPEPFVRERALIDRYIKISDISYPGCIQMKLLCDPIMDVIPVPPLLIHNFVENVIKHVVMQGKVTHIILSGTYKNGEAMFQVIDDGMGITKEKIEEIEAYMHRQDSDGHYIGYYNSLKRLQYYYGDQANITIESEQGKGTVVTIRFPYTLKESEALEAADRK